MGKGSLLQPGSAGCPPARAGGRIPASTDRLCLLLLRPCLRGIQGPHGATPRGTRIVPAVSPRLRPSCCCPCPAPAFAGPFSCHLLPVATAPVLSSLLSRHSLAALPFPAGLCRPPAAPPSLLLHCGALPRTEPEVQPGTAGWWVGAGSGGMQGMCPQQLTPSAGCWASPPLRDGGCPGWGLCGGEPCWGSAMTPIPRAPLD